MNAKLGMLAAIGLSACTAQVEVRPMNDAELERLDEVMEIEEHGNETVKAMARAMGRDIFNEQGNRVTVDEFLTQYEERRQELQKYYREGRIVVFTKQPDVEGAEAVAAFHNELPNEEKEYVAFDAAFPSAWSAGVLLHEMAHDITLPKPGQKGGHSDAMLAAENELTMANLAWTEGDFAVEYSTLHQPTDYIVSNVNFSYESSVSYAMDEVEAGRMTSNEALEYFDRQAYTDKEDWITGEMYKYELNHKDMREFLALSTDQMADAWRAGTLYEYSVEQFSEARLELEERLLEYDEAAAEAKRETERERHREPQGKSEGKRL